MVRLTHKALSFCNRNTPPVTVPFSIVITGRCVGHTGSIIAVPARVRYGDMVTARSEDQGPVLN